MGRWGQCDDPGSSGLPHDGFTRLMQLRQSAANAEQRDAEAMRQLALGARHAAAPPSWSQRRMVPGSPRAPVMQFERTEVAPPRSELSTASVTDVQSTQPQTRSGTKSGWGNLGDMSGSGNSGDAPLSRPPPQPCSEAHAALVAASAHRPSMNTDTASSTARVPIPPSQRRPSSRERITGSVASQTDTATGRLSASAAGVPVARSMVATSQRRPISREKSADGPQALAANRRAELANWQQSTTDGDEETIRALSSPRNQSRCTSKGPPKIPKPSADPPSLRAWRQRRGEEPQDAGSSQAEAKVQVARMKANLKALTDEIQELQTIMIDDVTEFQENVQEIKGALQARAARRAELSVSNGQGSAEGGMPAWANVQSPSARSTQPSTPRSSEDTENPVANISAGRTTSTPSGRRLMQERVTCGITPRPLPQYVLRSLLSQTSHGGSLDEFAMLPEICIRQLSEALLPRDGLLLASISRRVAMALHDLKSGRRFWPHVLFRAGPNVQAWRSTVLWSSIKSMSLFGLSDASCHSSLDLLLCSPSERACAQEESAAVSMLCINCGERGDALTKYKKHGDLKGIGDSSAVTLVKYLGTAPLKESLRTLDLSWNHLADEAMTTLSKNWPETLTTLRLDWNCIGIEGARALAQALRPALRTLDLRSNPLRDDGVKLICSAVEGLHGLQWLGLGETLLSDEGADCALPHLKGHSSLAFLDLSENLLTDAGCPAVAAVVSSGGALRSLLLRGFLFEPVRITDKGGTCLARALGSQKRRFELSLDYQQVGCGTASTLATTVAWERLSLFNTNVSTQGATSLATSLKGRTTAGESSLTLNVAQCRIGDGAVSMLRNAGLTRLDAWGQRTTTATKGGAPQQRPAT